LNNQNPYQILVVGPAWVGDMVMAQSLFIYLKNQNPDVEIDVLAPDWSIGLIERMPEVRAAISLAVHHGKFDFKLRYLAGKKFRDIHYNQAIITPRSYKSALVPFIARIPIRTGYRGEFRYGLINDIRLLDKNLLTKTVQRYVFLAAEEKNKYMTADITFPKLEVNQSEITVLVERLKLNIVKPIVALLPGAEYGVSKQWPISYFKALAQKVVEKGFQVWVLGSDKDKVVADQIITTDNVDHTNLCGKTSLVNVVDLLSLAKFAITNDSGLMHIACATNVKVIALYGSSSPLYTPPLHKDAVILYKNLECSPCFKRACQFNHLNCLRNITVDEVVKYVN